MRNYNSSFKVRLMIDRICLLALFILVLAISPLMAIDETRAEFITFDGVHYKWKVSDGLAGKRADETVNDDKKKPIVRKGKKVRRAIIADLMASKVKQEVSSPPVA